MTSVSIFRFLGRFPSVIGISIVSQIYNYHTHLCNSENPVLKDALEESLKSLDQTFLLLVSRIRRRSYFEKKKKFCFAIYA
jgi:hypothetical protein